MLKRKKKNGGTGQQTVYGYDSGSIIGHYKSDWIGTIRILPC